MITTLTLTLRSTLFSAACGLAFCIVLSASAQPRPMPVVTNDESGFEQIFDGKSLAGWEGDPQYWRVEDGALIGEVTATNLLKVNSFIVWRGGETRDFELKVEYRVSANGNSGINYRSTMATNFGPWAMRGYQADIDGKNQYTGQNYEEKGRTFLAMRGQVTRLVDGKAPQVISSLGAASDLLSVIKSEDWNEYHLIARGNLLTHILNGRVMSLVIDDDVKNRTMTGSLGVQVHVGPPMKVEYRNFRLKRLAQNGGGGGN